MNQDPIRHKIVYVHLTDDYTVKRGCLDIKHLTNEGYQRALKAQSDGIISILEHTEVTAGE